MERKTGGVLRVKVKHILAFAAICLVVFLVYATTRETLVGADSAAFALLSCNPASLNGGVGQPATQWLLSHVSCNVNFFKAITVAILFLDMVILGLTGEIVSKKRGWLLGLFAFANLFFLQGTLNFKEQTFGLPIILLSFYFLIRHIWKTRGTKRTYFLQNVGLQWDLIFSFLLLLLTGLVWKGAAVFVPLLGIYYGYAAILFAFEAWFFGLQLSGALFDGLTSLFGRVGQLAIAENLAGFGFVNETVLLLGSLACKFWKELLPATIFTVGIAFLSQKFTFYAIPFLGVGYLFLMDKYETVRAGKTEIHLETYAIIIALCMLVFNIAILPFAFPQQQIVDMSKTAVQEANGEKIVNEWGIGWTLKFFGGKTDNFAGGANPDFNSYSGTGTLVLTRFNTTCKTVLNEWTISQFPDNDVWKLYRC